MRRGHRCSMPDTPEGTVELFSQEGGTLRKGKNATKAKKVTKKEVCTAALQTPRSVKKEEEEVLQMLRERFP